MALVLLGEDVKTPKRRTRRPPRDTTFEVQPYLAKCGEVVRGCRERAGLSASDVALEVGMTPSPINHFETGKGSLHLNKFLHVCKIVGIPIRYPFAPHVPAPLTDIVDLLIRATPQMQAAVRAMLEATDRFTPQPRNGPCP